MKLRNLIFIGFLMCSATAIGQGIDFFHGTWEEALQKAEAEDKLIFVDAFAVWCGPCKRMAANVFPDEKVGEYYNKNFVNLKLDMERGMGLVFRKNYPVSAFPTLYYIDSKGEVVHKVKGAQQVDQFIKLGQYVLTKLDNSGDFAEEYENGNRDPELIYNYVKALNKANKPSLKIVNDYLKTQKDLTTDFNLKFILAATSEADSRVFDLLIKHSTSIEKISSASQVNDAIQKACQRTVTKAKEFRNEDLMKEAVAKMNAHHPEEASSFELNAELDFYRHVGDVTNYLKACNAYAKKVAKGDAVKLNKLATEICGSFSKDNKAMSHAEKLARKAAETSGTDRHYFSYAEILLLNGKKAEAMEAALKCKKIAEESGGNTRAIQTLIYKIEQS